MYNEKLALLDKVFKKKFSEQKTEINDSEIQDFKNKMIDKLNIQENFCQDFKIAPTILLKTIKY